MCVHMFVLYAAHTLCSLALLPMHMQVGFKAPVPLPDPFLRFDIDFSSPVRALVISTPLTFSVGSGSSVPRRVDVAFSACPGPCGVATGGGARGRPSWARSATKYCHLYHVTVGHPPLTPQVRTEFGLAGRVLSNLYYRSRSVYRDVRQHARVSMSAPFL
jgi:hypothetical protein